MPRTEKTMLGSHAPRNGEKLPRSCRARSADEGKIVRKHQDEAQDEAGGTASPIRRNAERQAHQGESKTTRRAARAADGTRIVSGSVAVPARTRFHRSRVGVSVTGGVGRCFRRRQIDGNRVYRKAENLVTVGNLHALSPEPDSDSSNRQTMCRLLLNSESWRL